MKVYFKADKQCNPMVSRVEIPNQKVKWNEDKDFCTGYGGEYTNTEFSTKKG